MNDPTSSTENLTYTMPLEVYLQAAMVRGVLVTNQDRVSSYLLVRQGEEVFSLRDATLESFAGQKIVQSSDEYIVYMREVFMIADLNPQNQRGGISSFYVKKNTSKALLSVGPYLVQGNIYLIPGSSLHDLLLEKSLFVPITDATIVGRRDIPPRTFLINRSKIGFMTAITDGLIEL